MKFLCIFFPSGNFKGMCKQIDHFPEETDYEADPSEYFLREYQTLSRLHPASMSVPVVSAQTGAPVTGVAAALDLYVSSVLVSARLHLAKQLICFYCSVVCKTTWCVTFSCVPCKHSPIDFCSRFLCASKKEMLVGVICLTILKITAVTFGS